MRDEAEVREVALHGGLEERRCARIAQRRAVLVEQIGELLGDLLGGAYHGLARLDLGRIGVVARHVLGRRLGRKLVVAHEVEVARQVDGLALDKRREQRHGRGLAPTGGQVDADALELLAQHAAAVLGLGAAQYAAEQRRVQALGRREATLHLAHRHLVLGVGAEEREAARHMAEYVRCGDHATANANADVVVQRNGRRQIARQHESHALRLCARRVQAAAG